MTHLINFNKLIKIFKKLLMATRSLTQEKNSEEVMTPGTFVLTRSVMAIKHLVK